MQRTLIALTVFCLLLAGNTFGAYVAWDGGGDGVSYIDGNNWANNLTPAFGDRHLLNGADDAVIYNGQIGYTDYIRLGNASTASLTVQSGAKLVLSGVAIRGPEVGSGTGTLALNGGTVDGQGVCALHIGYSGSGSSGYYNQTAGQSTFGGNVIFGYRIDDGTPGTGHPYGELNMGGGTLIGQSYLIGQSGDGVANITGGTVTTNLTMTIARDATSSGHVQLDGGVLDVNNNFKFGAGTGSMDIEAGTLIINYTEVEEGETWAQFKARIEGYVLSSGQITGYGWHSGVIRDYNDRDMIATLTTPEPATIALLGLGGLALLRRKRS